MRPKGSHSWLNRHFNDPFVEAAQRENYRSRASFKLLELHKKYRLFKPGMQVLDLGAVPGGWSQVASQCVGQSGRVIATDILPLKPLPQVEFIQGDFTIEGCYHQIVAAVADRYLDLVIADMSPNISGVRSIDQPRSMGLAELALEAAMALLKPGGSFVTKLFEGAGVSAYVDKVRLSFTKVALCKPKASRAHSREIYLVAMQTRK